MLDGFRDVLVIENEIVYIYFVLNGKVYCYFVGIIECEYVNGIGIVVVILKVVDFEYIVKDELYSKIIVFDVNIFMIKCMFYRIELVFKDVMKLLIF